MRRIRSHLQNARTFVTMCMCIAIQINELKVSTKQVPNQSNLWDQRQELSMPKAFVSFYGNTPVTGGLLTFLLAQTSCLPELKYTLKYTTQGCAVSKETESCHSNQSSKHEMHISNLLTVCNPRLIILVGFRLAPRQPCCWYARQISLPWGSSKYLSSALENGRDLPIKCLMWYWNGPQAV